MASKVQLRDVKDGTATIEDLKKLNALLDMQGDIEADQYDKAGKK